MRLPYHSKAVFAMLHKPSAWSPAPITGRPTDREMRLVYYARADPFRMRLGTFV